MVGVTTTCGTVSKALGRLRITALCCPATSNTTPSLNVAPNGMTWVSELFLYFLNAF